ncbi:putative Eukaryotic translation initiation factor 5B [Blattamonas nauphoetae]|uniref:Eukaryotic translation initiation factor 5B n=1 Tax=Blattamonas nauphoetae TaxID=2049346 RepID=A0ABQ9XWI2_9EUKA|nr:putative Eukaryotic translation initiation factor 5B [Blattamonas nauphoetae]
MPPKKGATVQPKGKGKSKAPPAGALASIAAIKKIQEAKEKQQQLQNREADEKKRREEEERLREEERQARLRKENEKKEEEKLRKKEQQKLKKVKDEQRQAQKALEELMLAGNVEISGLKEGDAAKNGEEQKRDIFKDFGWKKKKPQKKIEQEEEKKEGEDEADEDDWEAFVKEEGGDDQGEGNEKPEDGEEPEEDNWEDALEEIEGQPEETTPKEVSQPKAETKPAPKPEARAVNPTNVDLPMDEDSIMERHDQRMKDTITNILRAKRKAEGLPSEDSDLFPLRSPVVCILGHVDVGKTKILDRLRRTNVQEGEAGGITQQIGATFFPVDRMRPLCNRASENLPASGYSDVPGLLIIDTPGHESFTNLRSRGSSMCNEAILVVDIMHGLERQTIESLELLLARDAPFVIALNKIDCLYGWKKIENAGFFETYASQSQETRDHFDKLFGEIRTAFQLRALNIALYPEAGDDHKECIPVCPTSAHTGEGLPDLVSFLFTYGQKHLADDLRLKPQLDATVLEVKVIQGLGTTADIILSNGALKEGDTIVVSGTDGPIITQIRSLLTPHPMKEIRVKNEYLKHPSIAAAIGVKICATGFETAMAGSPLRVAYHPEEIPVLRDITENELQDLLSSFDREDTGTTVVASTVGSLESLITFLKTINPPIPIANVAVGPVHKNTVTKASVMLEKNPDFACILAFDVPVDEDAEKLSDELKVPIFKDNIIYRLEVKFTEYLDGLKQARKESALKSAIFPVTVKVLASFRNSDPLIIGVLVEQGVLRIGTPLVNHNKDNHDIGEVVSIEDNGVSIKEAREKQSVAVRIMSKGAQPKFLRDLNVNDSLISKINRKSIDIFKEHMRDTFTREDWKHIAQLKEWLQIL